MFKICTKKLILHFFIIMFWTVKSISVNKKNEPKKGTGALQIVLSSIRNLPWQWCRDCWSGPCGRLSGRPLPCASSLCWSPAAGGSRSRPSGAARRAAAGHCPGVSGHARGSRRSAQRISVFVVTAGVRNDWTFSRPNPNPLITKK